MFGFCHVSRLHQRLKQFSPTKSCSIVIYDFRSRFGKTRVCVLVFLRFLKTTSSLVLRKIYRPQTFTVKSIHLTVSRFDSFGIVESRVQDGRREKTNIEFRAKCWLVQSYNQTDVKCLGKQFVLVLFHASISFVDVMPSASLSSCNRSHYTATEAISHVSHSRSHHLVVQVLNLFCCSQSLFRDTQIVWAASILSRPSSLREVGRGWQCTCWTVCLHAQTVFCLPRGDSKTPVMNLSVDWWPNSHLSRRGWSTEISGRPLPSWGWRKSRPQIDEADGCAW
jgi:hypothetical protein